LSGSLIWNKLLELRGIEQTMQLSGDTGRPISTEDSKT